MNYFTKIDLVENYNLYGVKMKEFNIEFNNKIQYREFIKKNKLNMNKKLYIKCDFCFNTFESTFTKIQTVIESEFGYDVLNCPCDSCKSEKKRYVIIKQTELGKTSAQGHVISDDQKRRWHIAIEKSGKLKEFSDNKKGKTIEEIYGEEIGRKTREKLKQWRKTQTGENEPHLGCKNTEDSKKLMSESRLKHIEESKITKPYISPLTGESIDHNTFQKHKGIYFWNNMSDGEKAERSINFVNRTFLNRKPNSKWNQGYFETWYKSLVKKYRDVEFESSYEYLFLKECNDKKIFVSKNYTIYIPYIHPKDNKTHYYVPDFIIYEDESFTKVEKIVEIKPSEFIQNFDEKENEYYIITERKIEALTEFGRLNKLNIQVITEKDLKYFKNKNDKEIKIEIENYNKDHKENYKK
ncbi:MAG: hypothetical protein JXM74_07875 [Fusobacteriaceae bacterium]|nr:hypothetical protein [Fusobacteriaceae bacterium]